MIFYDFYKKAMLFTVLISVLGVCALRCGDSDFGSRKHKLNQGVMITKDSAFEPRTKKMRTGFEPLIEILNEGMNLDMDINTILYRNGIRYDSPDYVAYILLYYKLSSTYEVFTGLPYAQLLYNIMLRMSASTDGNLNLSNLGSELSEILSDLYPLLEFWLETPIYRLDLSNNHLCYLNDSIISLQSLRELDWRGNLDQSEVDFSVLRQNLPNFETLLLGNNAFSR